MKPPKRNDNIMNNNELLQITNQIEKNYKVTIIIEKGKSPLGGSILPAEKETVEVKAPREGLAKTLAMMKTTLKPEGRFVDYIVSEA